MLMRGSSFSLRPWRSARRFKKVLHLLFYAPTSSYSDPENGPPSEMMQFCLEKTYSDVDFIWIW